MMEQLKISELIKKTFCLGLLLSTAHIAAQESVEWTTLGNEWKYSLHCFPRNYP